MHGYTFISPSVISVCSPPTLSIMLASSAYIYPVWLDKELENWFDLAGNCAGRDEFLRFQKREKKTESEVKKKKRLNKTTKH